MGFRFKGKGRPRVRTEGMNKLESDYSVLLEALRQSGDIQWWGYEALKVRLAKSTFYTPDFLVISSDGTVECHEVKGFWEDDSRVKIKVAADTLPFRFVGVKKIKGIWEYEEF